MKDQRARPRRSAEALLYDVVRGAAVGQIVLFAAMTLLTRIALPFSDELGWIADYFHLRAGGSLGVYLWTAVNEHHLLMMRLLVMLDVGLFHVSGAPFVMVTVIAAVLAAALLAHTANPAHVEGPQRLLAWLAPMLVLTVPIAACCSVPLNGQTPLTLGLVVLGVFLFTRAQGDDARAERSRLWGVLAIVLSTLTHSVGFLALPGLYWAAWRQAGARRWRAILPIVFTPYAFIYVKTLAVVGVAAKAPMSMADHLHRSVMYLLAFLGLPLSRAPHLLPLGMLVGAAALALGAAALLVEVLRRPPPDCLRLTALTLVAFTLGAAVMSAWGRVDVETAIALPVRYTVYVAPLHFGLLALALPFAIRWFERPGGRLQVSAAAAGLAVLLLALQLAIAYPAYRESREISADLLRYWSGARDPDVYRYLGGGGGDGVAQPVYGWMKAQGYGPPVSSTPAPRP
jgi:hypothetical protein